jgi:hypothetical protein
MAISTSRVWGWREKFFQPKSNAREWRGLDRVQLTKNTREQSATRPANFVSRFDQHEMKSCRERFTRLLNGKPGPSSPDRRRNQLDCATLADRGRGRERVLDARTA